MEAGAARAKHRLLWDRTVHGWRGQVHKGNTKDGPRTDVRVQGSKVRAVEAARMHSACGACACWPYDAHLGAKRDPRPGNERLRGPMCALQVIDSAALLPSTFQARSLQLLDGESVRGKTRVRGEGCERRGLGRPECCVPRDGWVNIGQQAEHWGLRATRC